MNDSKPVCPRCGAAYSSTVAAGLCPRCLVSGLTAGLGLEQESLSNDPNQIGPYLLIEPIGEGGMGTVWRARQMEPVEREVALKVIKLGMDTREVIQRFQAERQALAMMNHPNIASVFDAGITEGGKPYFVMELVRGKSITDYCRERKLPIRDLLMLFLQVCSAIEHAHRKGVIHRDIKPSNVLVTGDGLLKVIDFGITKAMESETDGRTFVTLLGLSLGTPGYMSPEQAAAAPDIDARSDVYSLGALLYELLTFSPPFSAETFREVAAAEVLRIIRDVDPPRPSTRLAKVSAAGNTEIAPLRGKIDRDLERVVMKSLSRERERRYDSAEHLAADIDRFLNHEPVIATDPTLAYRFGKLIKRHQAAAISVTAVLSVALIALAVVAWQARRVDELNAQVTELVGVPYVPVTREVTNPTDGEPGSLRRTVLESKPGDRIVFAPELSGQTLFLPHGEITIDGEVNIDASELEEGIRISGNGRSRIFAIEQTAVVTLDSLSLIDGKAPLDGGAMVTAGIVTVRRCTFSGNRAGDEGGAIYADVGVLTVENSTFYQNSAHISGGGVYLKTGKFSATNCTFAGNSCGCSGGAVIVLGGTLTLDHCTIAGNTANTQGREFQAGGLYFSSGASGHLSHSVVAGNSAFNDNQVQVTAGTLVQTQNFTSGDPMLAPLGDYGGPTRTMPPLLGSPVIDSAVDTGNLPATDQRGLPRKVGPRVDLGATEGSYAPAAPLAVTRQASDLAPQTATLHGRVTANGAETTCYFEYGTTMDYGLSLPPQTLTAGSVEVDARPAGLSEDTVYHYRLVATNRLGTRFGEDRSFRTTRERVVRNVDDGGADSLRDVVANADPGDVIVFASSLGGQVIRLTKGKIVLDKNLTIDASALANGMVIDGDGPVSESRIFEISPGITSTMVGLTLTNGFAVGGYPENSGGAILLWRDSFLTLDRCTLVGNRSSASGGAILIVYGTLVIDNCTLMRNQGEHGGAIRNSEGTLIIRNSTLTQNEARDWGGAIYRFAGNFTIENSTLTRNTAKEGGALYNYTGRLTLTNSIVANNTATKSNTDIVGEFTGTNNLTSSDPMLAPLGDYGGPTRTMPPLPGSPAIDAGSDTGNLSATDQRGFSRMVGAQVDIGAVEVQSDLAPESLTPPR